MHAISPRMRKNLIPFLMGILIALSAAGCATAPAIDQSAIDAASPRIEDRIVMVCAASGLFRIGGDVIKVAYPIAALPVSWVEAGVDEVCANPDVYAQRIGTVEWLINNMRTI
jgi:hypothetical protein